MSGQIQCPNCGGYRIMERKKEYIDPATGKPLRPSLLEVVAGAVLYWFIICGFMGLCGAPLAFLMAGPVPAVVSLVLGAAMLCVGWAGGARYTRKLTVKRLILECSLCGYQWSWRTDEPLLRYRADPQLIQRGAQRLSEEAERLQQAAAAHFLEQQRGQQKK